MHSRRQFLRRTGAAAVAGAVALPSTATAKHFEVQPTHVTLEYDEEMLKTYQPRLVMSSETYSKLLGVYGWVAKSPEYDTDVCVYWCSYSHQQGWLGNLDSHYGDHEPVAVEVDSDSGDLVRAWGSVYHWVKGDVHGSAAPVEDDTHLRLKVIDPWHQYSAAPESATTRTLDVVNLKDVYNSWLANGLEPDLIPGASTNPWMMKSQPDYWRADAAGVSLNAAAVRAFNAAGVGDAGSLSDPSAIQEAESGYFSRRSVYQMASAGVGTVGTLQS